MQLSDQLARWRLAREMSQEEAAAQIGVSQGTWGAWEAGLKRPNLASAFAIEKLTEGSIPASGWGSKRRKHARRVKRDRPSGALPHRRAS